MVELVPRQGGEHRGGTDQAVVGVTVVGISEMARGGKFLLRASNCWWPVPSRWWSCRRFGANPAHHRPAPYYYRSARGRPGGLSGQRRVREHRQEEEVPDGV